MLHIWRSRVTDIKESCHRYEGDTPAVVYFVHPMLHRICRSHVTHMKETLRAHMKEPCHRYEGVMSQSHIWRRHFCFCRCQSRPSNAASYMKESCRTCERVISHTWRSRVTDIQESRRSDRYKGDTPAVVRVYFFHPWYIQHHIWRSHIAQVKKSCRTYGGVMSHIWRSRVTHMKETLPLLSVSICVYLINSMLHQVQRSHVAHMKESCRTYEGVMSQIYRRHSCSCLCLSRPSIAASYIYEGVKSHIWRSHVTDRNQTLLQLSVSTPSIHYCIIYIWRSQVAQVKESCHTYGAVVSHSHTCKRTQECVLLQCVSVTRLLHMCDMTPSLVQEKRSHGTQECAVVSCVCPCLSRRSSAVSYMGWLRLVGCLKS